MAHVEVELLPTLLATELIEDLEANENDKNNNLNRKLTICKSKWKIEISEFAKLTHNPIRAVVEGMKIEPNPDKQMIALSIGEFVQLYFDFMEVFLVLFAQLNMQICR